MDSGKRSSRQWPSDADVSLPAGLPVNASGVASRGGRYYAWADVGVDNRQALALTPLTRRFLSELAPGLGDFYFLQREFAGSSDAAGSGPAASKPKIEVRRAGSTKVGRKAMEIFGCCRPEASSQVALPPPVNRFDLDVRWGSLVRAVNWEHPDKVESALLAVHTRLSAILSAVLSPGGDELQGGVLVVFYGVAVAFLVVGVVGLAIGISMSRSITGAVHSLYGERSG